MWSMIFDPEAVWVPDRQSLLEGDTVYQLWTVLQDGCCVGLYQGVYRRLATQSRQIEDEQHFLIQCLLYSLERQHLLNTLDSFSLLFIAL